MEQEDLQTNLTIEDENQDNSESEEEEEEEEDSDQEQEQQMEQDDNDTELIQMIKSLKNEIQLLELKLTEKQKQHEQQVNLIMKERLRGICMKLEQELGHKREQLKKLEMDQDEDEEQ